MRKAELHRVDRLIAGMATDLHQLAKLADATGKIPAETSDALVDLRRLIAAVEAIAVAAGYDPERDP
jgi:hypothetical protein